MTKFSNPVLYTLSDGSEDSIANYSSAYFLMVYVITGAIFYGMLLLIFLFGPSFYNGIKKENFNEGTKIIIRSLSILMLLFLTVLQVPFFTLLLQGYNCGENPEIEYSLASLSCTSTEH